MAQLTMASVYDKARYTADAMGEAIGLDPMRVDYGADLAANLGGRMYRGGGGGGGGGRGGGGGGSCSEDKDGPYR